MNFPLYASLTLLAISLTVFVALVVVGWIDGGTPPADPDWEGRDEP